MYSETNADLIRALNKTASITETDLDGCIISVNAEFCRGSGYSEEELIGSTHNIVNSRVHSEEFFNKMWETIQSGEIWFGEVCNRKKSGELYWLQVTVLPIYSEDTNEIYKYVAIRFDITERKKRETALQRHSALYQAVIETTDGFCRVDSEGRFLEVSDGYCHLTGYSRDDLLTMKVLDLNSIENPIVLDAEYLACIMKVGSKIFEVKRQRKDNSTWVAEITASYSPVDNGSIFILLRDITKRKNAEKHSEDLRQQLNHMQKLDSIGRLTAGIAHDFNNILASILGYTEMNLLFTEDLPEGNIRTNLTHNLHQVEISGKRAAELIEKMMTYCRQHVPKKVVETKPTAQVINEVVKMLRSGLTESVKIELTLDEMLNIVIDPIELHQVLTNLLVNARDAMKK